MVTGKKIDIYKLAYSLFFITLFSEDWPISNSFVLMLFQLIRYFSYFLFALLLIKATRGMKEIRITTAFVGVSILISIFTHDIYFVCIALIILASVRKNIYEIVSLSYKLLICLTLITFFMAVIGVFPNLITARGGSEVERQTLGFYHSDVLPLILFHLIAYKILLVENRVKWRRIIFWVILTVVVYEICGSRNGLIGNTLLILFYLFKNHQKQKYKSVLCFFSKYLVLILSAISLFVTWFQGAYNDTLWIINQLFSGRFAIAYHQLRNVGIHLVNLMSKTEYTNLSGEWSVIDNGYLYVMLRYGVLFIVFYFIVHNRITKKNDSNYFVLIVSITVSITNMVDNDLFSYGYLPIILMAFGKYISCPNTIKTKKSVNLS